MFELVETHVQADMSFMEAGLDSLGLSELQRALGEELSTVFSATLLFDHPSIESLLSMVVLSVGAGAVGRTMRLESAESRSSNTFVEMSNMITHFIS